MPDSIRALFCLTPPKWCTDTRLDQSQGDVLRQLVVSAASQRHREGFCGATATASEMLPAEQYLGE